MRYRLIGINVDVIKEEIIYETILKLSERDKTAQIVFLDTFLLVKAKLNKDLAHIINTSDMVIPISAGIKFGLKFFKYNIDYYYNIFNFCIRLLTHFTDNKKIVYAIGGNEKSIVRAEQNLRTSFPGIKLMGKYQFNYKKEFEKDLIINMKKVGPSLIIVSAKRPKCDKWIAKRKHLFKSGVFIGADNFLSILGAKDPASKKTDSKTFRRINLITNPFRIFYYFLYLFFLLFYKFFRS